LKPFLPLFISCNEPINHCEWCKKCEKCAFIFLLLSAWLPPTDVKAVFGSVNMLANQRLTETFLSLMGAEGRQKPFEVR
jgi:hypothetical protein